MSSVAKVVLPVAGAVGGFFLGGIGGAAMGANLGSAVAGIFDSGNSNNSSTVVKLPPNIGNRLSDLRIQASSYGRVIAQIYGSMRLAGNIIWSSDITEIKSQHTKVTETSEQEIITYSYKVSLAIAICKGEIDELLRIWADGKLLSFSDLDKNAGKFNIHLGSEDQLPDDIIARYEDEPFPAYRSICYVVIEDFPLVEYGNRIPNFTFEVKKVIRQKPATQDKIEDIILLPGSGEYVYSTQVTTKSRESIYGEMNPQKINMNNSQNKANVIIALDQMQNNLPNIKWVSIVLTWFATSSNADDSIIIPKVEFKDDGKTRFSPNYWKVRNFTRDTAKLVLRFEDGTPTYGGWFNLDPLWASDDIDVVGIDAYFPLTQDLPQTLITEELIRKGWESGEGWDYYCIGENRSKNRFNDAKYAWKNLEYWWKNNHRNPDGFVSSFIPELFNFLKDKKDKEHELKLINLQIESMKLGNQSKLEEINIKADIDETKHLYNYIKPVGIKWVDSISSLVRPFITYSFFLFYITLKILAFHNNSDLITIWSNEDQAIFSAVIGFWFGARAFGRYRKANQISHHF